MKLIAKYIFEVLRRCLVLGSSGALITFFQNAAAELALVHDQDYVELLKVAHARGIEVANVISVLTSIKPSVQLLEDDSIGKRHVLISNVCA